MVRVSLEKIYCKILFWGISGAGKNTAVDILYHMAKNKEENDGVDIQTTLPNTRIPLIPDLGLFFDRGVFQSTKKENVYFHVYTCQGDPNLSTKWSKNLFRGTDGIVFVFDGQQSKWDENVASLSFLKQITAGKLLEKIPLTVLLTKVDLPDAVKPTDVTELLKAEGLLRDPIDALSAWNPVIFDANLLEEPATNAYKAFADCAQRVGMYQIIGGGNAPTSEKTTRINLVIPESLKSEWERFSGEVVHASMSQMIRDAVREYMKKMQQSKPEPESNAEDTDSSALEKMIEKIVSKKLDAMLKKS
ncbi:MAG TPA: ADP-ribosylation factor-like protein [Candidatus Lokiarchaeia archaeon]|nr:ADP-ribosylation factor-like protein [Candidatus Lokiarchaeia archaeon]